VRDGTLLVGGVPVHRTAIGRDPVTPVRESHLPTLLGQQVQRPIHLLRLAWLRGEPARTTRILHEWRAASPGIVLADAATPQDLDRLARLVVREGLFGVAAGSAGLATALGAVLSWPRRPHRIKPDGKAPVLLVVGSPNPTSLEQVAWVEKDSRVTVIRATLADVVADGDGYRRELARVVKKARTEIAAGRDAVLTLAQPPTLPSGRSRTLRPTASRAISERSTPQFGQVRASLGRGVAHCGHGIPGPAGGGWTASGMVRVSANQAVPATIASLIPPGKGRALKGACKVASRGSAA